jgi:hypothetical protein
VNPGKAVSCRSGKAVSCRSGNFKIFTKNICKKEFAENLLLN